MRLNNPYKPEPPEDEEEIRRQREAQEDRLQAFGNSLAGLRDEWIRYRQSTGWDRRVARAIDQYEGKDAATKQTESMMRTVENGGSSKQGSNVKPTRSTVFINITRQKTNGAEARLADILLPTDERNFGIKPTPKPSLAKELKNENVAVNPQSGQPMVNEQGQPILRKQVALMIQQAAEEAAKGMEREIDDQLNECDYKGEVRKVIHDAAVMGTGVVRGPTVTSKARRQWKKIMGADGSAVYSIAMSNEKSPSSSRVDPRNVWEDPACGEDIQNGRGIFERDMKTAKQIRALAKQPGYMESQLRKVLEEGPQASATQLTVEDQEKADAQKTSYEVWTYWGEIEPENAKAAGLNVTDDVLQSIDACVVMINSTVVKAFLSPLDTGELPYDFFPWEKCSDSARGKGVPELMESQQRVLNAAWRTMMDNSGSSSGPQVVMKRKGIEPADGVWDLSGRKIWWCTDDTIDVRNVFNVFQIDSRQTELAGIIQLATQLIDEETGVPMIMQGNERNAPETVGGMQMLMNASNVVLRRLVKQFDDKITRPHIRRYYDYNMLYSENDEIKGDYEVDARGSSALLVRDIQNQAFMNLLGASANPAFAPLIDPKKIFEKALQAQHVDPRDIMLSDEQIEQNRELQSQQQPQDSSMAVAQIRSQTELQKAQLSQASDMEELNLKLQMAREDREFQREMAQMSLNIEMVKLAQTEKLSLESIKAQLGQTALKERSRKELFNAEAEIKMATGQGI